MKRGLKGVVACAVVGLIGWPTVASSQVAPTVTVVSGPTTETTVPNECSDAIPVIQAADSFVIKRDAPGAAQDVSYTTSGSAIAGTHYEPLSGSATIPAAADQVSIPVHALNNPDSTRTVTLTITVAPSADYAVGDPSNASISFVSHRDPALPAKDCNPDFQLTSARSNMEQTIRVGDRPRPIETTAGARIMMSLVSGALPPGTRFDPGDGPPSTTFGFGNGFLGAATKVGTTTANLRVCPQSFVFTCRTTSLTVHVVPRDDVLARTGAPIGYEILAALLLLALGTAMRFEVERRRTS